MYTVKKLEYGTDESNSCDHSWVRKAVGAGHHQFCIKCGMVKITSGVVPTVLHELESNQDESK